MFTDSLLCGKTQFEPEAPLTLLKNQMLGGGGGTVGVYVTRVRGSKYSPTAVIGYGEG
jgi:hypothetical protein